MIWDKNLERIEKYMDKQMENKTDNQMTRKDHIEVLSTMAIGRTEKETIEYAIKQIKQAKKWRRKARIEYQRGYEDAINKEVKKWKKAYDLGYEDGAKVKFETKEEPQTEDAEWLEYHYLRECSKCHSRTCWTDDEGSDIPDNFCPNCGAKMRKESE
jgi:hypothetical protein